MNYSKPKFSVATGAFASQENWDRTFQKKGVEVGEEEVGVEFVPGDWSNLPIHDLALQLTAQCWCDPETEDRVMDPALAAAFARRLKKFLHALRNAEDLIAESSDWHEEDSHGQIWIKSAVGWMENYRAIMGGG